MAFKHIGFMVFMALLLIAPKIPLGGAYGLPYKASVPLGIVGLVLWRLAWPNKLLCLSRRINVYCPLFWLKAFAVYAFVVSLCSREPISIAYGLQYLLYVVLGADLMRRYAYNFNDLERGLAFKIFFFIGAVYALGIIVSVYTGPIYPHQVSAMFGRWEGLAIQKGVGFAENQNMAGPVTACFLAAAMYLYRRKSWQKWMLVSLLLYALLATLSRGAIFSFFLALIFVYGLDTAEPLLRRAAVKISVLRDIGTLVLILSLSIMPIALMLYFVDKPLIMALLAGFGLGGQHNVVSVDTASRFELWAWGVNHWMSQDISRMMFGGGFRSSMEILSDRGTWKDAHNVYITILCEFGIVGLVLFLASLFTALFRYVRLFVSGKAQSFEKFGLLALLSLSINNMAGPYFYSPVCLSLLIMVFAVTFPSEQKMSSRPKTVRWSRS